MLPILFVLGFGIIFGLVAGICFPFGLDITGNTAGQTMNNGTHVETPINPTSAPSIDVTTTESSLNTKNTPEEEPSSVYRFAFFRTCMYYTAIIYIFNSDYMFICFLFFQSSV